MHTTPSTKRPRGFSLVELLITIFVLGVLSALALASMSNIAGDSAETVARAQAQRIVSIFESGRSTGAPGFVAATGVDSAMNAVGTGSYGSGANRDAWFQLGGITAGMDDDKPLAQQARHYLSWQDGMLNYLGEGGSAGSGPPPGDGWQAIPPDQIAGLMNLLRQLYDGPLSPPPTQEQLIAFANQVPGFPFEIGGSGESLYYRSRQAPEPTGI